MRAVWKGAISFGLVTIPVSLYPATRREELKFRLLRKSDQSPVNYKRVAEADGKEERSFWRHPQLFDGPVGHLPVVLVLVALRKDTPINERVDVGSVDELGLRPGGPTAVVAPDVHLLAGRPFELRRVGVVKDLAARQGRVSVPVKELK